METTRRSTRGAVTVIVAVLLAMVAAPAGAVHFYRGSSGGCSPRSGELTDDATGSGATGATVQVLHNTFNDAAS